MLDFKPVEYSDYGKILPFYLLRSNKTCDSVFLETFIWKDYYHIRYAIWENRAILWLAEVDGKTFSAMPLCRPEDLPAAFKAIEQYFNEELHYPLVINLADEEALDILKLDEEEYAVEEQVDSRDYLYDGESMRTLAGKKMHKKKNRLNVFLRNYEGRCEYRRLSCGDAPLVREFLRTWREQKEEEGELHLDSEAEGIEDTLRNCAENAGAMGGVFIDGKLEAFTIGALNPLDNMAVIIIEKANPEIDGLYQFINREFLRDAFPEAALVNREDDMGIPGLRKAKQSYNPVGYARKYLVQQKCCGQAGYHWAEHIGNTAPGPSFEYLSQEDKEETLRLYRSAFPEDSEGFSSWYYREKVKNNRILVRKDSGLIVSMVHLNPYRVILPEAEAGVDYLCAVATEENRRHEGHYRAMFRKLLSDQHEEGKPFTWLVPVDSAIYEPLGFETVGKVPEAALLPETEKELSREPVLFPGGEEVSNRERLQQAAEYMEKWLDSHADCRTKRDMAYAESLAGELESDGGGLYFLKKDGEIIGLCGEYGAPEREQRLFYAEDGYALGKGILRVNMARITNVEAMLALFGAGSGEEPFALRITVTDPVIEENNVSLLWTGGYEELAPEGEEEPGTVEPLAAEEAGESQEDVPALKADQGELIRFLLGGEDPETLWPEASPEAVRELKKVRRPEALLLDEVI